MHINKWITIIVEDKARVEVYYTYNYGLLHFDHMHALHTFEGTVWYLQGLCFHLEWPIYIIKYQSPYMLVQVIIKHVGLLSQGVAEDGIFLGGH